MNYLRKYVRGQVLVGVSMLALLAAVPAAWAQSKTESQLIADLNSGDAHKIIDAFQDFEKHYPTSTGVVPYIKKFLNDTDEPVKRKAAREAGLFHVDLSPAELKQVCALLSSSNPRAVVDALKALRDLKKPEVIPDILPCLSNSNKNVLRDACRTLAVLGNKDLIPSIEPLLHHSDSAVQKDARDAISKLQSKS